MFLAGAPCGSYYASVHGNCVSYGAAVLAVTPLGEATVRHVYVHMAGVPRGLSAVACGGMVAVLSD